MGHYSTRYGDITLFKEEAKTVFEINTFSR